MMHIDNLVKNLCSTVDRVVTEEMKSAELRYIIARKDAKIKQLEMENELMRDFLSLTERK